MNQSKEGSHLVIQAVGLIYVAYLMVSLISDYCNGKKLRKKWQGVIDKVALYL